MKCSTAPGYHDALTTRSLLWPTGRSWSDEQSAIVQKLMHQFGIDAGQLIDLLREMALTRKFAPTPAELREHIVAKQGHGKRTARPAPSTEAIDRQQFAEARPYEADAIRQMSDRDIRRLRAKWEFERSLEVYGPRSPSTAARYAAWQQAEAREDGRGFATNTPETMRALADAIERGEVIVPEHHHKREVAEAAR